MAYRNVPKITRTITAFTFKTPTEVYLYGQRTYTIKRRRYSIGNPKDHKQLDCDNKTCKKESDTKPKSSLWMSLMGSGRKKPKKNECDEDNFSDDCLPKALLKLRGNIKKTEGSGYIITRETEIGKRRDLTMEEKNLKIMEANLDQKENALDPLPHFTTVEQRLLDLSAKKLHPLYKRYLNVSRRMNKMVLPEKPGYKTRSGPINPDDIPLQLKYNKKLLETKNLFSDYKRVEPPRQLVGRLIEMKQNEKPGLRRRMPIIPSDSQDITKERSVFDTLYQKQIKF